MAAPMAMLGYALIGTSRQLVVSATTATAAVSAATFGPLAGGDPLRFAALSAALALVVAVVLIVGGLLRFGAISDLVSKPVMTGFLFGLGLVIALAQIPSLLGVRAPDGNFFPALWDLLGELDTVDATTLAVGAASLEVLILGPRLIRWLPSTLLVLVLSAEAVGVARGLAVKHGYRVDPNRDLVAMGASNALAGLASGFVQSGGASQTAAADGAGAAASRRGWRRPG